MAYLLDTHTFLWMRHEPSRLGEGARNVCGDTETELLLSVVSVWEMAIKLSLGKLRLPHPLRQIIEDSQATQGIRLLAIEPEHVLSVQHMPFHHRDPFDRLLVSQVLAEGLSIVSVDEALDAYGVTRVWGANPVY